MLTIFFPLHSLQISARLHKSQSKFGDTHVKVINFSILSFLHVSRIPNESSIRKKSAHNRKSIYEKYPRVMNKTSQKAKIN